MISSMQIVNSCEFPSAISLRKLFNFASPSQAYNQWMNLPLVYCRQVFVGSDEYNDPDRSLTLFDCWAEETCYRRSEKKKKLISIHTCTI